MKNCNKCYYYRKTKKECKKFIMQVTDPEIFGMCCKSYSELKDVKVKCKDCKCMNKYGWCNVRKICMNEEERFKNRKCRSYFKRKIRAKKEKY